VQVTPPNQNTPGLPVRQNGGVSAEDRGFEPLRAVNPTRIPSVRHRPLGESSARNYTGSRVAFGPPGEDPQAWDRSGRDLSKPPAAALRRQYGAIAFGGV
jgi:hypothetical protein